MSFLERAPRLAALLIGFALLAAVEGICRLAGAGDYRDRPDPFAGFARLQSAFVPATDAEGRAILAAREEGGPTRQFLASKPADGFRVFVFGGSTEAGTPYGYAYAFAAFLQELLARALPDRTVEVVNCAVAGYASRRLLYLAQEVAAYEPDLYIVSTGHNEVIEQRLYAHLYDRSPRLFELQQRLRSLRVYVLLEDGLRAVRSQTQPEIEADELYVPLFGPLATKYWQDEPRDVEHQRALAETMFRTNVDRMIRAARRAGAEVLLLSQSKNYADWPVVDTQPGETLTPQERARFDAHAERAEELAAAGDAGAALAELERALALDPASGATWRRAADLHRQRGEYAEAVERYRRAHNTALSNFGTTPGRNRAVRELARERGALFLDVDRALADASPHGLVGFDWFVDFLHPNLAGHQLIAREIFRTLRDAGVPEPAGRWREPPPLASPAQLLAGEPRLRAQELRIRIVAEVLSQRDEVAAEHLEQLRRIAPDDPQLAKLERWIAGELPFDFELMYLRE